MTWQIRKIAVFGNGKRRSISFKPACLNVVTGRSQTGKSTILEVVDYCLLSKTCRIPKGKVREAVDAVGLLIERDDERLASVRYLPQEGHLATSNCWISRDVDDLPDEAPKPNRSLKLAKEEVSSFTGIEDLPLLTMKIETDAEDLPPANIRQCSPYLFQYQDVVANRHLAFSGTDSFWRKQHLVDSLGYFVGALSIKMLLKRRELQALKISLNAERRRMMESKRLSSKGLVRGRSLWTRARALDLVSGDTPPESLDELDASLHSALKMKSENVLPDIASTIETLEIREKELMQEQDRLRKERQSSQRYLQLSEDGATAARSLHQRLSVRRLFPSPKNDECPICGNSLPHKRWENQLATVEKALGSEAEIDPRINTQVQRQLRRIDRQLDDVGGKLRTVRDRLLQSRRDLAMHATDAERHVQRQRLAGRVEEYLSGMASLFSSHETGLEALREKISRLEAEVGDKALRKLLRGAQEQISKRATALATNIGSEFPEASVELRLSDLSIRVRIGGTWAILSEIGSGANWVTYHVACALALHDRFVAGGGPVPRVLLLDQPSQAWFPPDRAERTGDLEPTDNADKQAVRRLYSVIHEFCLSLGFQVIVVDHARPAVPWFSEVIVEDWHEDGSLVPTDWFLKPDETEESPE